MSNLVFAVGHYLGPYHPAEGRPAIGHVVRVGRTRRWLRSDTHLLAWIYAHGIGELAAGTRWTRSAIVGHARRFAAEDVSGPLDELVADGLVAELAAAPAFATTYRLRPLMMSLGRDPETADGYVVGLPGRPAVPMSRDGRRAWLAAQQAPTLWAACEALDPDPAAALSGLVDQLRGWLSATAGYLDLATT